MALDSKNRNRGYLLGRLFAVYEGVQIAVPGHSVGATMKEKAHRLALSMPARVFVELDVICTDYLSRPGRRRQGPRSVFEHLVGSIFDEMNPRRDPFPTSLPAADRRLFVLGYHHQRNALRRRPRG